VKKKPPVTQPPPPPPPPGTGSQAEIAARLNDEGKNLMYSGQYEAAGRKFREAVARVPEAKYFFNLCTALFQEGKFGEAMSACNAVARNQPTADQQRKTDKLLEKIREFAKEQGIDLGGR
jgi:tetratricopeptide (TPR) repeat protein